MRKTLLRGEIDVVPPDRSVCPGMYGTVTAAFEQADAVVLPKSAVVYQDEAAFCFLVEDGKAVRCQVQTGQADGDLIEVLRRRRPGSAKWDEWTGDEDVAVSQLGALVDGAAVERK